MQKKFVANANEERSRYHAKEERTHLEYILYVFENNDARQPLYNVFDANGTKSIGVLRKAKG